jgi:uncharacterized glyoxalase superfamily protein PhnB
MAKKMNAVSAAPSGWQTLTPRIVARDAKGLVDFLRDVFGAEGKYESERPSTITIGDSKLMISDVGERKPSPAFLYVYVQDPDAVYRRALAHGVITIEEPLETPYGDRRCMIEDRWGNTWQIARRQGQKTS